MQDLGTLFNLALGSIGDKSNVSDPEEQTAQAKLCRLWLPSSRKQVLAAAFWPSNSRFRRLARKGTRNTAAEWTDTDPAPGWLYSYSLPNDYLHPRYLHSYFRFALGSSSTGRLLYSNEETPILAYSADVENPALWEPELFDCVQFVLGSRMNIARNGKAELSNRLFELARIRMDEAITQWANTEDQYTENWPQAYAEGGYDLPSMNNRFIYPTQTLGL